MSLIGVFIILYSISFIPFSSTILNRYVTGVLLYLAIHRIHTQEFEVEGNAMMIVAALAVVFNVVLGLLLHGVCQVPHSHSHSNHSHFSNHHGGESDDSEDDHEAQVSYFCFCQFVMF